MLPTRLDLDASQLDDRLLWSQTQHVLAAEFEKLVQKCNRLAEGAPIVLVTTDAEVAHLIAVFNLARALSFESDTFLIDTTPKARLIRGLLGIENQHASTPFLLGSNFMAVAKDFQESFKRQWHRNLDGVTGDRVLAVITARDAFKLDWTSMDDAVRVIAIAAPNEMEEERWIRLSGHLQPNRLLGLWVVD